MTEIKNVEDITQQSNSNNTQNNTSSSSCVYDKYGRSPDKKTICGIGKPSASKDTGSGFIKCIFKNECPHCHHNTLKWAWNFGSTFEGQSEGGSAEGHFFCVQADGGCDADYSIEGHEHIDGSTFDMEMVSGPMQSTEEEAKALINGQLQCDGSFSLTDSSSETTGAGGSVVSIPDKTFYGLIKQIMGSVDGLFIIANNMAYLLSFKDFYEYRNLYDSYIPKIEPNHILDNTLEKSWTINGFYNSIEVTYADGIIKKKNDALVNQYGENVLYYDFPSDNKETAQAKASALLAANVRDYSTEIKLSIFYNENITAGSWVKLNKKVIEINKKPLETENKQKNTIKRKGITIENLIEKTIIKDGMRKKIQSIKDEKGKIFNIEEDDDDYESFFVQGYTCRWDKDNSLIMDLLLKYGPDTPEDPVNATIGVGGTSTTNSDSNGGQYGNDCFTISDICVANNKKILGHYSGGSSVQKVKELVNGQYQPEQSDYQPRANQNSNYNKKYSSLSAPEVYTNFRSEYKYSYYADNASCWKCASDFYDNAGKTANCGDSTCLLKVFYDCIGVPSCGVHIDGHYFNAIQINGTWEIIDGVRQDNQTCNFPDGSGYCFGNPYPCNSYKGESS